MNGKNENTWEWIVLKLKDVEKQMSVLVNMYSLDLISRELSNKVAHKSFHIKSPETFMFATLT